METVNGLSIPKKSSPNGKLTAYLCDRNLVASFDSCDPAEGVILVDDAYLNGRKVYGQLIAKYQYGREDDEVMGIKFSREYLMCKQQIYPTNRESQAPLRPMLKFMAERFHAHPFQLKLPINSPNSVELQLGRKEKGKPMGVFYRLECYVASDENEPQRNRSMVVMDLTKLQRAVVKSNVEYPRAHICKGTPLSCGQIDLEVLLDKEVYFHGQPMRVHVNIMNWSKKKVVKIKNYVVQTTKVTMIACEYSLKVASLKTTDGCPIGTGGKFSKTFMLTPLASSNTSKRAVAMDGHLSYCDKNLASTTLVADGKEVEELGITVSYVVKVELSVGPLESISVCVPFKLIHPPIVFEKSEAQIVAEIRAQVKAMEALSIYEPDAVLIEDLVATI